MRSGKRIGDAEAKDIYLDVLKPQLQGLEAHANNSRRALLKKAALKVASSSALLAFGIFGGVLPAGLTELFKAVGGFSVAKDVAETIGAIERNPTEIRNHNLYFLLRLRQTRH